MDHLLTAAPAAVRRMLCGWFTDERPLRADGFDGPDGPADGHPPRRPTVATAAQTLLYARRALAPDDLADALVDTPHPCAADLLLALAEDEPATLSRAVARWARDDERPERRAAAARYAGAVVGRAEAAEDRALLRAAALALLGRTQDAPLHGPALALLVRDPETRERWLPQALRAYAQGAPGLPTALVAEALPSSPQPVLAALRGRLSRPGRRRARRSPNWPPWTSRRSRCTPPDSSAPISSTPGTARAPPAHGSPPWWTSGSSRARRPARCCFPWSPRCSGTRPRPPRSALRWPGPSAPAAAPRPGPRAPSCWRR